MALLLTSGKREAHVLKLLNQLLIGSGVEPLLQALIDLRTDAMQLADRFRVINGCLSKRVDIWECCRKCFGVDLAHMVDAEPIELACPWLGTGCIHG